MKRSLLVCAVTLFLFIQGCSTPAEDENTNSQSRAPVAVEAIRLQSSPVKRVVRASSTARGVQEVMVTSQTSGTIQRASFSLGQFLRQGALLVEVESDVAAASLEQSKAAYESALLNLTVTEKLYEQQGASEAEMIGARVNYTGAKTALRQAQTVFSNTRITAPVSGFIAQKENAVEKGNVIAPGMMVARIVNITSLKVTVAVGEREAMIIENGMDVRVTVPALGDTTLTGKVTAIGAGSFASSGSFPVEVTFSNTDDNRIKSGMAVNVSIETVSTVSSILIPLGAVIEREREPVVVISQNNRALISEVTTGRISGDQIEILEGLTEGQILLLTGISALSQGDSLSVTMVN